MMVCKDPNCKRCQFLKRKIESICESTRLSKQCFTCKYQYKDEERDEPCYSCTGYSKWVSDLNGREKE